MGEEAKLSRKIAKGMAKAREKYFIKKITFMEYRELRTEAQQAKTILDLSKKTREIMEI